MTPSQIAERLKLNVKTVITTYTI
ncbi:MAG: hypothetical protein DSY33_04745 [Archaeoglobus sp.]|nr:MAG: hypothetical protein DSY33_04745 [Archaeoglobus sp.]